MGEESGNEGWKFPQRLKFISKQNKFMHRQLGISFKMIRQKLARGGKKDLMKEEAKNYRLTRNHAS